MKDSTILWFLTSVCFLLLEMGNPGLFFFLSFFFGSLAAAAIAQADFINLYQYITFFSVSLVAFVVLKFWVKRRTAQGKSTNAQALIGKRGLVLNNITPGAPGAVKINGEIWSAKSADGHTILAASWVIITDVRGAHVFVKQNNS